MRLTMYRQVICSALSGLAGIGKSDPRALPWAKLCWPFGPEETTHKSVSPTAARASSGLESFVFIRVHSWFTFLLIILSAAGASAENLLANPGFEDLAGDKPSGWDQFVQPMPGAAAALADTAHGGAYAVQLHIPAPYDKDPLNNWSQNLFGEFGGKTIRVSGFIRVEEATEAALLVQLWRKKPWGVIGAATTSTDMPVYGTQDWQEVSMDVPVPEGVDFVTLRCVLKGSGSAWFDDIAVALVEPEAEAADAPETKKASAETPTEDEKSTEPEPTETPGPVEVAMPDEEEAPATEDTILPQDTVLPLVNQLESEVRRLRDANEILTSTLQEIQDVNQALLDEMLAVQAELQEMKEGQEGAAAPPLKPGKRRVPPLVPLSQSQEFSAP